MEQFHCRKCGKTTTDLEVYPNLIVYADGLCEECGAVEKQKNTKKQVGGNCL